MINSRTQQLTFFHFLVISRPHKAVTEEQKAPKHLISFLSTHFNLSEVRHVPLHPTSFDINACQHITAPLMLGASETQLDL